jgi:hypothetical protein
VLRRPRLRRALSLGDYRREPNVKGYRELSELVPTRVVMAALDPGQVGRMHLGRSRERFDAQRALLAETADRASESGTTRRGDGHAQARCLLRALLTIEYIQGSLSAGTASIPGGSLMKQVDRKMTACRSGRQQAGSRRLTLWRTPSETRSCGLGVVCVLAVVAVAGASDVTAATNTTFRKYELPRGQSYVAALAQGRNDTIYLMAGSNDGSKAFLDRATRKDGVRVVRTFTRGKDSGVALALAVAPDGAIWMTHNKGDRTGAVVYRDAEGHEKRISVPKPRPGEYVGRTGGQSFLSLASCNKKHVWLAGGGSGASRVIRLSKDGRSRVFVRDRLEPDQIVCGPNGTVWFTANIEPTHDDGPCPAGPEGQQVRTTGVGRITKKSRLKVFKVGLCGGGEKPQMGPIVLGPQNRMWFQPFGWTRGCDGYYCPDTYELYFGSIDDEGNIRKHKTSYAINDLTITGSARFWAVIGSREENGVAAITREGNPKGIIPKTESASKLIADRAGGIWFDLGLRHIGRLQP